MGQITTLSKVFGDDQFAHMMESMSILSDVQEQIENSNAQLNELINHAKFHLSEAMKLRHTEKQLPGELFIFGGIDAGR